jgi:hypothetical protein
MATNSKDRQVNTDVPVNKDAGKRLPHERDESPEGVRHQKPRSVIRQAAEDIEQGMVDTDLHGTPGIQKAPPGNGAEANPLPDTKRD